MSPFAGRTRVEAMIGWTQEVFMSRWPLRLKVLVAVLPFALAAFALATYRPLRRGLFESEAEARKCQSICAVDLENLGNLLAAYRTTHDGAFPQRLDSLF